MKEKELKELEKFTKENGYNDELKDIYLREVLDQNKKYEWDLIFKQTFDYLQIFFKLLLLLLLPERSHQ